MTLATDGPALSEGMNRTGLTPKYPAFFMRNAHDAVSPKKSDELET